MKNKTQSGIERKQEFIQFLKFTAFSCTAGAVQAVSFTLLNELTGLSYGRVSDGAEPVRAYNFRSTKVHLQISRQHTHRHMKILAYYASLPRFQLVGGPAELYRRNDL
jgi:hypothetical protein